MEMKLSLPIGIEDFKEVRKDGYYYVDKTALIEQVLEKRTGFLYDDRSEDFRMRGERAPD